MRLIGRIIAVMLVFLIIPSTAIAFWIFNLNRVATDPNTYKNAFQNTYAYDDLLHVIVVNFTRDGKVPRHAEAVVKNLLAPQWGQLSPQLMPAESARQLVNTNVDAIFNWIDGSVPSLHAGLDLDDLKARMSGPPASAAIDALLIRLRACDNKESPTIANFAATDSFANFPVCNPTDDKVRETAKAQWLIAFNLMSQHLPAYWDMMDALNNPSTAPNPDNRLTPVQLEQSRSSIWLLERLRVNLFLIPIGLMCLIVIVTIRSGKGFFRWLGWALILSGFFSLIPIFLTALINKSVNAPSNLSAVETIGTGGQALEVLFRGMVLAALNNLTLSVVIQVAVLIVVGLMAVFLSVLIAPPEPELSDTEMAVLIAQQNSAQVSQSGVMPGSQFTR